MPRDLLDGVDPKLALVKIAEQCGEDSRRWFPSVSNDIGFQALAIAGEAGEFANIVKKCGRGSLDPNTQAVRHDLAMELTDILIYVLSTADLMHIDLYRAYLQKRAINEKRFSNGES
jgi:NTP pyrophosphatase (non-canonical NTP hydrolase)